MTQQDLLYEVAGGMATITVNRSDQHNSFTWSMWEQLRNLARQANSDPAVRAVVIQGAGGKAFASGADIRQMAQIDQETWLAGRHQLTEALEAVIQIEKPVIAQIQGYALGGGLELALACDMRYATPDSRLGIPAGKRGIVISLENYRRLMALIGPARTSDLVYTARLVSGEEAASMGLVNEVVPGDRLEERVREVVAQIYACSPSSARGSKRSITHCLTQPGPDSDPEIFALEAFASPDFREGVTAFLEKRAPNWGSGRK